MMQRIYVAGLLSILLILTGCTSQETPTPPGGADADVPAAPAPASDQVGTVTGRILNMPEGETEPRPIDALAFYLGETLVSDTGVEGMTGLSKTTSPQADLDEEGNIVFVDVPIGRYVLWLDTPRGPISLRDPATEEGIIVEITGGDTVELGEIVYDIEGL